MKVLLKQNLDNLGERGTIVEVKPGYARNYLLPRNLAVIATDANTRQLEAERARLVRVAAKERAEMEEARKKLEGLSCTISAAASPEGHLYGSVGPKEIAAAFKADGVEITESQIKLEENYKEPGVYLVPVELAKGLEATVRVWIVPAQS